MATVKPSDEKSSGALTIAVTPEGTFLYVVNGGYPGDRGDYQGHVTTINVDTGTSTSTCSTPCAATSTPTWA